MIAVRDLTTADEVFANAKRVRDAFFRPRPNLQAQVAIPAEHAVNDAILVPVTPEPQVGSRGTSAGVSEEVAALSDVLHLAAQVASLQTLVRDLRCEVAALREDVGFFQEIEGNGPKAVSMAFVRALVVAEFQIARRDLESQRRSREYSRPRFALMWLLKEYTSGSFVAIGRFIGRRDHTTIMSGLKQFEVLMAKDAAFRATVEAIQARIHAELAQ